jgi:hypothetical protein
MSVYRTLAVVPCAVLMAPMDAQAISKAEAAGEHIRLSEEMTRLAKRGHWRGVDRSYRQIAPLLRKGVIYSFDDHYMGAQAARELGNVTLVYRRLVLAKGVKDDTDVSNWLADLMGQYGEVELIIPDRYKGEANLAVAMMPLQPDQRSTIGMAQQRVTEGRSYDGLLPGGEYTFGPHTFSVEPGGDTIVLNLDKKGGGEVSKRAKGEKEPFRFTYMGPRVDVGAGWTQATDSSGSGPGGFGGVGGRAMVGWEMGIGGPMGAMVQVGYQGLTGSPSDEGGTLEAVGQFNLRQDQLHMGMGWLAATANFGSIWTAFGPLYGFGTGAVTGVSQSCIDAPNSCSDIGGNSSTTLRYSRLEGSVRAGGVALTTGVSVMEFGRLRGAISLHGGALTDNNRWFPFGTLGLTVGPAGQEDDG